MCHFFSTIWDDFGMAWFPGALICSYYVCVPAPATGDPRPLPHPACPNPCPSVNEVEDLGTIVSNVRLKESLSVCDGLVIVRRLCCSTHPGSELCHWAMVEWH